MTIYEFLLDLMEVLKWPIIVVLLALLFRRSLARVLLRTKRAQGGGMEVEFFEREAEKIGNKLAAMSAEQHLDSNLNNEDGQLPFSGLPPSQRVSAAHRRLARSIWHAYAIIHPEENDAYPNVENMRALASEGHIDGSTAIEVLHLLELGEMGWRVRRRMSNAAAEQYEAAVNEAVLLIGAAISDWQEEVNG